MYFYKWDIIVQKALKIALPNPIWETHFQKPKFLEENKIGWKFIFGGGEVI